VLPQVDAISLEGVDLTHRDLRDAALLATSLWDPDEPKRSQPA
jgi:hypothetical protein